MSFWFRLLLLLTIVVVAPVTCCCGGPFSLLMWRDSIYYQRRLSAFDRLRQEDGSVGVKQISIEGPLNEVVTKRFDINDREGIDFVSAAFRSAKDDRRERRANSGRPYKLTLDFEDGLSATFTCYPLRSKERGTGLSLSNPKPPHDDWSFYYWLDLREQQPPSVMAALDGIVN
jgi:hypothetical protein